MEIQTVQRFYLNAAESIINSLGSFFNITLNLVLCSNMLHLCSNLNVYVLFAKFELAQLFIARLVAGPMCMLPCSSQQSL